MDDVKRDISGTVDGRARITIHFKNRVMWQKYRRYVLKTDWDFNDLSHPYIASREIEFHNMDDVSEITKQIIFLLQLGFDIYSVKWELTENIQEDEQTETDLDQNLRDLWKPSYEEMEDF